MADVDAGSSPRTIGPWMTIYLKGVFMGAADTVPGVSGGTIALITGIYDRLIAAITALDPRVVMLVGRLHTAEGRRRFLGDVRAMDVPFLLVLGLGIATAVLVLSSGMHAAVTHQPVPTYAFFTGLIAASAVVLYRYVAVDTPGRLVAGVGGFLVAFAVAGSGSIRVGSGGEPSVLILVLAGGVAVTAMVLPGVSGAFILVLLGLYEFMSGIPRAVVDAVVRVATGGDPSALADPGIPLLAFLAGAVVGVLTVAHAVRWALDHYREATLSFLVALMLGGLRAPIRTIIESTGGRPSPGMILLATVMALIGVALVLALDRATDDLVY